MTTEDILIVCEHALKPYEGGDKAFKGPIISDHEEEEAAAAGEED